MIYLTIVSVIWAFSFGLIGGTLTSVDPFVVASLRLGCATLLFLPFLRIRMIDGRDRARLIVYGAIQFGLMYGCYMLAFQYLPSHLVAIFSILTPVYVVLIYNFQKARFTLFYLLAALCSVGGAFVIKAKTIPTGDFWTGFFLMQGAGMAFAFGQVAYRHWKSSNREIKDQSVFGLLALGGMLSAGCFSVLFTEWENVVISTDQWIAILYLGAVASGLGFFLWNKGASVSNPGTLAAFNNAVVPLAVICSLFLFDESKILEFEDTLRLLAGSTLIVLAVGITAKK